ncbi:hypothetical protein HOLleu_20800 [Holothuria leucospilota]|uniref:Secreted protein n=1 Tax=Holothuria leucospilota TaxID=206669 RepID=A0A9Q1C259_HOLLE|nr:hypothetical protein HOLleu_20800 [Holothuria leucospilota]
MFFAIMSHVLLALCQVAEILDFVKGTLDSGMSVCQTCGSVRCSNSGKMHLSLQGAVVVLHWSKGTLLAAVSNSAKMHHSLQVAVVVLLLSKTTLLATVSNSAIIKPSLHVAVVVLHWSKGTLLAAVRNCTSYRFVYLLSYKQFSKYKSLTPYSRNGPALV